MRGREGTSPSPDALEVARVRSAGSCRISLCRNKARMKPNSEKGSVRQATVGLLILCLFAVSACGSRSKATVTGTVKYKGEIVPSGQVIFYGAGNASAIAVIDEHGAYKAIDVP